VPLLDAFYARIFFGRNFPGRGLTDFRAWLVQKVHKIPDRTRPQVRERKNSRDHPEGAEKFSITGNLLNRRIIKSFPATPLQPQSVGGSAFP